MCVRVPAHGTRRPRLTSGAHSRGGLPSTPITPQGVRTSAPRHSSRRPRRPLFSLPTPAARPDLTLLLRPACLPRLPFDSPDVPSFSEPRTRSRPRRARPSSREEGHTGPRGNHTPSDATLSGWWVTTLESGTAPRVRPSSVRNISPFQLKGPGITQGRTFLNDYMTHFLGVRKGFIKC